jgi:hypothetical protein
MLDAARSVAPIVEAHAAKGEATGEFAAGGASAARPRNEA